MDTPGAQSRGLPWHASLGLRLVRVLSATKDRNLTPSGLKIRNFIGSHNRKCSGQVDFTCNLLKAPPVFCNSIVFSSAVDLITA